jgi:tetratricopeptide (TPR) repeat protein/TolB-like protein/predicted Ser/Thr protein kinase
VSIGPGSRLSHYEILDEISRGGMGVVYRALDLSLNREVALKVLPPELVSNTERRQRFIQEAQAASALEHPNIAVIYEIGEADGVSFIAMELIRGEKLSASLSVSPLAAARALELAVEMAEALALAHDKGIVHRDLKPANVMVTQQGHAKIIDFGLAKLVAPIAGDAVSETKLGDTNPGTVLGTVSYMSPEQVRGGRVDHRTDIFSFGILLHEMLCGQPPFRGPSGVETLNSILTAIPPALPSLGGAVSPDAAAEIQRIRDKCLAKAPDDRYQGMRDVVVDLRAARRRLESSSFAAVPDSKRVRRFWWAAAVAVVGVIGVAFGANRWWSPAAVPADTKPSLAVLYFENNTGNESLDWMRTGLADMLVTDLSQSPELEIVGTDRVQQILTELNRADSRSVSFDVVQELARRAGVNTVLVGSYVKAGESIRINVRLQDTADGRILAAERVDAAGESHLFATVDDLTRRIKAKLEPLWRGRQPSGLFATPVTVSTAMTAGVDRDLREVTTSSIEAYRYYAEGINLHERQREAESIPLFEKALAVDPNFALAMAKLAVVHSNLNHPAESADYARRAFEHVDRVTARERYYIEGYHFGRRQETLARAIEAYEKGLSLYPDHASVRNNLALLYVQLERQDDALPHLEELRRRGMTFPGSYGILASIYVSRGEFETAVKVLQEYLQRHPDVAQAHGFLGNVLATWGKLDDALAAFDRVDALDPGATVAAAGRFTVHVLRSQWAEARGVAEKLTPSQDSFRRFLGHSQLATLQLYRGHSTGTLDALERAARAYTRPGPNTANARIRAAAVQMAVGNPGAALAEALKARSDGQGAGAEWPAIQAVALAQLVNGRTAEANRTLDELRRLAAQLPSERELRRVHHLAGQIALDRGDHARAAQELVEAAKRLPRYPVVGPGGAGVVAAQIWFSLGSVYLAMGNAESAEPWFRRIVESTVERANAPLEYVRSVYLLATIHESRGEKEKARAGYQRFLEHWRDGDLDRDKVANAERKLRALATD